MKDCIRCEHRMCVFVCVCVTEREKERRKVITFQSKHFLWTRLVSECGEISFSSFFISVDTKLTQTQRAVSFKTK